MSRYYDSETATFITIDSLQYLEPWELSGIDLYAYCYNNPIMYYDPTGHIAVTLTLIGLIIGAIIGATIGGILAYNIASSTGATGWELAGWTILGVLTGAVIGGAIGAGLGALGGAIFPGINAALANGFSFGVSALMNLGGVLGFGMAEVAVSGSVVSSVAVSGAVAVGLEISILLATTNNRGRYWGQKYSNDHSPEHVHLKGTDGTDIRIGRNKKPLKGEPPLKTQQRKALKRLWQEFLELFNS